MERVLSIRNLHVSFDNYGSVVQAVRGVSLDVAQGETLALVGESGCGKTTVAQSILRLHDGNGTSMAAERLTLGTVDVLHACEKELDQMRARLAGMVFQDPLTCLNPTMKVGRQITERLEKMQHMTAAARKAEAVRLLNLVCIPDAALRAEQFPHQFSGGMRQRIMIAMALAANPSLLIADEPTTALDVTIQMQILQLLHRLRRETGTAILLITHDFGVVGALADRVAVMYAGKIVEEGVTEALFHRPAHPYTEALLKSLPLTQERGQLYSIPGAPPDLTQPFPGCAFARRCTHCMQICLKAEPPCVELSPGHTACCWHTYHNHSKEART